MHSVVNSAKKWNLTKFLVASFAVAPVSACLRPGGSDMGYFAASGGSSLTSIDMTMPEASVFETRSQELAALIQNGRFGYHLKIVSTQNACSGASSVDQTGAYGSNLNLSSSIRQGCDYALVVELGELSESQSSLSKVYFRNDPALQISRSDIDGKDKFQAAVMLKSVNPDGGTNPSDPIVPEQVPQSNYPSEKDVDVINAAGSTVKLSSLFHGEYLLLDFSQSGCGACVSLATKLEQDSAFQKAFNGQAGSCAFATVVPKSDRTNWLNRFPASGKTGSHTIAPTSGGFSAVASKFDYTISATPTMLLINKSGQLVDQGVGRIPSKVSELCNM